MSEALAEAICFFLSALPQATAKIVHVINHNPNNAVVEGTFVNGQESKRFRVTVEEVV